MLFVFGPIGDAIVDSLRSRPAAEDDWTALRRSLALAVAFVLRDPAEVLTLLRLVRHVPTLCARLYEKQAGWRPRQEQALLARATPPDPPTVVLRVRAAAAFERLTVALQSWVEREGHDDPDALLDIKPLGHSPPHPCMCRPDKSLATGRNWACTVCNHSRHRICSPISCPRRRKPDQNAADPATA